MLGVFAEFEANLRRERQLEGIAQAKIRGVYEGRKPSVDTAEIERLRESDGLPGSSTPTTTRKASTFATPTSSAPMTPTNR